MSSLAERLAAAVATATLITAVIVVAARPVGNPDGGPADPPPPTPVTIDLATVGAATTLGPTPVRAEPLPDAPEASRLRGGVLLPVLAHAGDFLQVMTPCEVTGWVEASATELHVRAEGTADAVEDMTLLIDPGHGGVQPGASGRGGLREKDANLEISRRLVALVPAARVFLTNDDFTAGLNFRTQIANRLGAHVFISIHNNAGPDGAYGKPGTETYYQIASPESKRLAGLLYEELFTVLVGYEVSWVGDRDAGAKYRPNAGGDDYYAIPRLAEVPTVLVEALFISNPPEEELLRNPEVLDRMAAALARGIDRYVTTDDPGSGFTEPYPRAPGPRGLLPSTCVDPF